MMRLTKVWAPHDITEDSQSEGIQSFKAQIKLWLKRKKKIGKKVTGAERIKVLSEKVRVFKSLRKRKRKREIREWKNKKDRNDYEG